MWRDIIPSVAVEEVAELPSAESVSFTIHFNIFPEFLH
jgi:hypothetical protein